MPRTGRPRKPTKLKLLQGTFRKDRAPKREPRPTKPKGVPPAPAHLGAIAKAEWRRVAPVIHKIGMLGKGDLGKLAMYCQAYARWRECEKIVDDQGMTFTTYSGYVMQRPEVSIGKSQATLARQLGSDFGLDPSSRTRIEAPELPPEHDEDEEFLMEGHAKRTG